MKNIAHSITRRLLALAKENNLIYNDVLRRYLYERFFFRVGHSEYSKNLILKGGTLFVVWQKAFSYRPTMDADMLFRGSFSEESLLEVFQTILQEECNDGVSFILSSLKISKIREDNEYGGNRVTFTVCLGTAQSVMQVDIGIGDSITPNAKVQSYPTLLEFPEPKLRMYPPETSVAEKVETMVKRSLQNSRMKDFYDVWVLSKIFEFDVVLLRTALANTFKRRGTPMPTTIPVALTDEFANDEMKQIQWCAFIKKSRVACTNNLPEVIRDLRDFLLPVLGLKG